MLASRAIYSYVPPKKSHNTIIIIYIGLCVSSYYFATVSDCQLPFFLFSNSAYGVRACVERSSPSSIQVTYYCPGNTILFLNMRRFTSITLFPSLSQSVWNTRFYYGHLKPYMNNNAVYFQRKHMTLILQRWSLP